MSVDVAAIKARLEPLRDLPWSWRVTDDRRWAVVEDANSDRRAQVNDDDVAEFIAHAPADVAALLAEVEQAERARARAVVQLGEAVIRAEAAEAERDALAQRLARVAERAATKVYADDVSRLTAELEAAVERGDAAARERDEWKSRRDHAVEECRFLHQEGMSRRDHHLKHCGAARAAREAEAALEAERAKVARVEALRDSWLVEAARDECRCGWCDGCTARAMALDLRAALGGEEA